MKEVSYMDPLFQNLRVEDLTAYLRKSGWKRISPRSIRPIAVCESPHSAPSFR